MVQNLVISGVKLMLRLLLRLYFKEIRHTAQKIDQHRPLVFLANHQNALLDALLIAAFNERKTYFLVRSDVFKRPWVSKTLNYLGMYPIYRIRDGKHTLNRNEPTLNFFAQVLVKGNCVLIFPEGNHSLRRTVRPLRKGFIEIADKALAIEPELDLGIVPIGLSYKNATCFNDCVAIHYSAPIEARNLFFSTNTKKERDKEILTLVHKRLSTSTVHIATQNYESIEQQLITEEVDFLKVEETNRRIEVLTSSASIQLTEECSGSEDLCKKSIWIRIGYVIFWPALLLWRRAIYAHIKEPEFISSFRFAYFSLWLLLSQVTIVLFLIYLL